MPLFTRIMSFVCVACGLGCIGLLAAAVWSGHWFVGLPIVAYAFVFMGLSRVFVVLSEGPDG